MGIYCDDGISRYFISQRRNLSICLLGRFSIWSGNFRVLSRAFCRRSIITSLFGWCRLRRTLFYNECDTLYELFWFGINGLLRGAYFPLYDFTNSHTSWKKVFSACNRLSNERCSVWSHDLAIFKWFDWRTLLG